MLPANDRLRCGPTLAFAAATLVLAFASLAPRFPQTGADELEIEFIGNMAFRLGDGATTLYSDFPYRSGAFGYMTYDLPLAGLGDGASLITHEHADHWDAQLFAQTRLELIAHPSIAARVPSERVLSWDERISYGGIEIEPIATEHTPSHRSYLVHWRGLRLYFTGDTESTAEPPRSARPRCGVCLSLAGARARRGGSRKSVRNCWSSITTPKAKRCPRSNGRCNRVKDSG